MRSMHRTIVVAAAGMLLVPQLATASDVEADIREMQTRMDRMEEQLQATNEQLADAQETVEQQQAVIDEAQIEAERGAASGLSSFLEATDFNAWMGVSYAYKARSTNDNSRNPQNKVPQWGPGFTNGNTFSLDQLWFEIDKAATEESRAGFHADLAYGRLTNNVPGGGPIYTAYVTWLAPLGTGLQIDGGVMGTLIGAEVIQTNANLNITRGLVWGLQPVNVTGASASYEIFDSFSVTARILNDNFAATISDPNREKSFEGQIAFSGEKFGVYLNGGYGRSGFFNDPFRQLYNATLITANNTVGILDLVLTADPLDNLTTWVDVIWRSQDLKELVTINGTPSNLRLKTDDFGLALAARIGVLERTGFAMRGEWVRTKLRDAFIDGAPVVVPTVGGQIDAWAITATVDQGLTDNLELNAEFRYDGSSPGVPPVTDGFLLNSDGIPTNSATYGFILQLLYEF